MVHKARTQTQLLRHKAMDLSGVKGHQTQSHLKILETGQGDQTKLTHTVNQMPESSTSDFTLHGFFLKTLLLVKEDLFWLGSSCDHCSVLGLKHRGNGPP